MDFMSSFIDLEWFVEKIEYRIQCNLSNGTKGDYFKNVIENYG